MVTKQQGAPSVLTAERSFQERQPPAVAATHTPGAGLVIAIMGAGYVVAAFGGIVTLFDGSYYLFNVLQTGSPFVPHFRLINAGLELPVILASRAIDSIAALSILYGLTYACLVTGLLSLCWWIVRREAPHLFVWPVLCIGLAMLTHTSDLTSEANVAVWLSWPIFLSMLVPPARTRRLVALVLGAAAVWTHPHASLYLAAALGLAVAYPPLAYPPLARKGRPYWGMAGGLALLLLLSIAKLAFFSNPYESAQLSFQAFRISYETAVRGLPLRLEILTGAAALLLFLIPGVEGRRTARMLYVSVLIMVALAGLVAAQWVQTGYLWVSSLNFRTVVPLVTLPLMGMAALDALLWRNYGDESARQAVAYRRTVSLGAAAIFFLVFAAQGITWHRDTNRLRTVIAQSPTPCINAADVPWLGATPLAFWATTPQSLLVQGRTPRALVLTRSRCGETDLRDGIPAGNGERIGYRQGWFDLSELRRNVRSR